jgi:GTP cyclohydrolase II
MRAICFSRLQDRLRNATCAAMSLRLSTAERVARARADLRIGAAVALASPLVTPARLAEFAALGAVDLAVTARRAETLKARAYDGDIARIAIGPDMDLARLRAAVDPALALAEPMIGPFTTRREGSADAHRLAVTLCKQARLLPAAVVVPVADAATEAARLGLTLIAAEDMPHADVAAVKLAEVSAARVPIEVA